jgi:hypothetical protein
MRELWKPQHLAAIIVLVVINVVVFALADRSAWALATLVATFLLQMIVTSVLHVARILLVLRARARREVYEFEYSYADLERAVVPAETVVQMWVQAGRVAFMLAWLTAIGFLSLHSQFGFQVVDWSSAKWGAAVLAAGHLREFILNVRADVRERPSVSELSKMHKWRILPIVGIGQLTANAIASGAGFITFAALKVLAEVLGYVAELAARKATRARLAKAKKTQVKRWIRQRDAVGLERVNPSE